MAEALSLHICQEAGLIALHGETPTDYQARVAALHGRQDAAACFALLTVVIAQQKRTLRWARAAVVLSLIAAIGSCTGDSRAAELSAQRIVMEAVFDRTDALATAGLHHIHR